MVFVPAVSAEAGDVRPVFGAVVDRDAFRFSRSLPDAKAGVAVLTLDAHVLAYGNALRDVRIVDAKGRQIPYVVERRDAPLAVPLALTGRERDGSRSVYRFDLPYPNFPSSHLVLATDARGFDRRVQVRQHRGRVVTSEMWRSESTDHDASPLRLELPYRAPRHLELVVDEGDNEPLPIRAAKLELDASALRFVHPGTALELVYGNRRIGAPRYDVALVPARLAEAPAYELRLGPPPRADDEGEGRRLFWIGAVVAAVVLVALLLRLVLRPETSRAPGDTT